MTANELDMLLESVLKGTYKGFRGRYLDRFNLLVEDILKKCEEKATR